MTIYTLADQCHLAHSRAEQIAAGMEPRIRIPRKSGHLTRYDEARLRRAFLDATLSPHPTAVLAAIPRPEAGEERKMNNPELFPCEEKIEGMTLALLVEKTGLGESKLKMILSRHEELQAPPYSTKAGGARVFFPPFVAWLEKYEGKDAAESQKSRPVTSVTRLPSGAQLRELRLLAERGTLEANDIRRILGIPIIEITLAAPEPKASPEIAESGFRALNAVAVGASPARVKP